VEHADAAGSAAGGEPVPGDGQAVLFGASGSGTGGSAADPPPGAGGGAGGSSGAGLSAAEQRVYRIIPYDPLLQDAVIRAAELPPGVVLAALTMLELKGLIKRLPGNLVVRVGRA
jgi:hypothetical protein